MQGGHDQGQCASAGPRILSLRKFIAIQIQGGTTFVGQEEEIFLKQEKTLWTPSGKESKLGGKHVWPFEFSLPSVVNVKDGEPVKKSNFRLPPSFTERASPAYIDYKIIITVKRGFLRVNQASVLITPFSLQSVYGDSAHTYIN